MTPEQKKRCEELAYVISDKWQNIENESDDLNWVNDAVHECVKAGYAAAIADCAEREQGLLTVLQKSKKIIVEELSEIDCDCGFDEPIGEGYQGGTCRLHSALNTIDTKLKGTV
jgi:hypothetical protein